jgi:hypothetical protein
MKSIYKFFLILTLFVLVISSPVHATDFNTNAKDNIDLRIASKHAASNKPIYSLQNHTNGIYTRNPDCWAADIDLTCVSPWNSRGGNKQAGTLITPRHCILAAHYNLKTGDSIRFVTKDNLTIRRKIIAHKVNTDFTTNKPDIEIITLDSDVPSSITPCQFLPSNYKSYISNDGDGLPVLYTDQEEKALVADIWSINSNKSFDLQVPVSGNRLALNESVITGDSGNPIFLILNGRPVIIGCFTYGGPGSGNALSHYANLPNGGAQPEQNINDLIVATDALTGINTGYRISYFDFSTTSSHPETEDVPANVFVKDQILHILLRDNSDHSQVMIFDGLGKLIKKQFVTGNTFFHQLTTPGVYIIKIQKGNQTGTYKVFTK